MLIGYHFLSPQEHKEVNNNVSEMYSYMRCFLNC